MSIKMAKDRKKPLSEKIKKAKAGKVSSLEKVETAQIGKKIETPVESVLLETNMVREFVDAIYKLQEVRSKENTNGMKKSSKLFDDLDTERINLMISSIKLPSERRQHVVKFNLPHSSLPNPCDVCLIVKDLTKGIKVDHEPTANHFKELLSEKGIGPDLVSTVMPIRELTVEYSTYETKRALSGKFDVILADDRIISKLPELLGRAFYRKKSFPLEVDLKKKNLKGEIVKALHRATLPLNHQGTSAMVTVGNMTMKKEQIVENLMKIMTELEAKFPGGSKNIRSMHLKTETSMALPIFVSDVSVNELDFVDARKPVVPKREPVTDEVSTVPGYDVTVYPDGTIKMKKKADPEWESFKANRDDSDEEEIDEEEDVASDSDEEEKEEPKEKKQKVENAMTKEKKQNEENTVKLEKKQNVENTKTKEKKENVEKAQAIEKKKNAENMKTKEKKQNVENTNPKEKVEKAQPIEKKKNVENTKIKEKKQTVENTNPKERVEKAQSIEKKKNVENTNPKEKEEKAQAIEKKKNVENTKTKETKKKVKNTNPKEKMEKVEKAQTIEKKENFENKKMKEKSKKFKATEKKEKLEKTNASKEKLEKIQILKQKKEKAAKSKTKDNKQKVEKSTTKKQGKSRK